MLENLFKRKNKKDSDLEKINSEKIYNVKDLYVAYPALITRHKTESDTISYNQDDDELEQIIVRKIGTDERYVENVLNGRQYGIFLKFHYTECLSFLSQYMVDELNPLELFLDDKTKNVITIDEIREFLYPELKKEDNESKYRDVVLREINETNNKINSSKISNEEKENLKKVLIQIANYYVETLKSLSIKNNQGLSLDVNKKSIISLRQECMKKLVEIELMLAPEDINDLIGELNLLEEEIKKI